MSRAPLRVGSVQSVKQNIHELKRNTWYFCYLWCDHFDQSDGVVSDRYLYSSVGQKVIPINDYRLHFVMGLTITVMITFVILNQVIALLDYFWIFDWFGCYITYLADLADLTARSQSTPLYPLPPPPSDLDPRGIGVAGGEGVDGYRGSGGLAGR